jgi:hypothetical protein
MCFGVLWCAFLARSCCVGGDSRGTCAVFIAMISLNHSLEVHCELQLPRHVYMPYVRHSCCWSVGFSDSLYVTAQLCTRAHVS